MCSKIIFVEARTHFDVLLLKLKLKAIQYKSSDLPCSVFFLLLPLLHRWPHSFSSISCAFPRHTFRAPSLAPLRSLSPSLFSLFAFPFVYSKNIVCYMLSFLLLLLLFIRLAACTLYSTISTHLLRVYTCLYLFYVDICTICNAVSGSEYFYIFCSSFVAQTHTHTLNRQTQIETILDQSDHDLWTTGKLKKFFVAYTDNKTERDGPANNINNSNNNNKGEDEDNDVRKWNKTKPQSIIIFLFWNLAQMNQAGDRHKNTFKAVIWCHFHFRQNDSSFRIGFDFGRCVYAFLRWFSVRYKENTFKYRKSLLKASYSVGKISPMTIATEHRLMTWIAEFGLWSVNSSML